MSSEIFKKVLDFIALRKWVFAQMAFNLSCVIGTIVMFFSCIGTYILDRDVSLVNYKKFNSNKDSIYPSVSLCFGNPYKKEILQSLGANVSTYTDFLVGKNWEKKFAGINYDNVTVDINDYILGYEVEHEPFEPEYYKNFAINTSDEWLPPQVGERSPTAKCFNQYIPYINMDIFKFGIQIKMDIFPRGMRPSHNDDWHDELFGFFGVNINYNNQFLSSRYRMKSTWLTRQNDSPKNVVMNLDVTSLEVFKQRNKRKEPCFEGWPNFDHYLTNDIVTKVGCRPPYVPTHGDNDAVLCSTKDKMAEFYEFYYKATRHEEEYPKMPCQTIEKVSIAYNEVDAPNDTDSSWLKLDIRFAESTYKEFERVKAYSVESLIGNAG